MIQRKQSVYLIFTTILSISVLFGISLFEDSQDRIISFEYNKLVFIPFILSALISTYTIMIYQKRKRQIKLCKYNICLNILIVIYFICLGIIDSQDFFKNPLYLKVGSVIPFFNIFFLMLSKKSIKKDEELIKSIDRVR